MNSLFGASMDSIMHVMLAAFILITAVVAGLAVRNRLLFKLALRNPPRRRAQTVLIIVGLMLSTVIVTSAFGAGDTFSYSIRSAGVASLGPVDEMVVGNGGAGSTISTGGGSSFNVNAGSVAYLPASDEARMRANLAGNGDVDGVAGTIVLPVSVQDLTTRQTKATAELAGIPAVYPSGFGPLISTAGKTVGLGQLGANEVYLNQRAADALNARPGDSARIFAGSRPIVAVVRGIVRNEGLAAGGLISAGQRSDPEVLLGLGRLQALTGHAGQITNVLISNSGDDLGGASRTSPVSDRLRSLLATPAQVSAAGALLHTPAGSAALRTLEKDGTYSSDTQQKLHDLRVAAGRSATDARLAGLVSDPDVVSALQTIKAPAIAAPLNTALASISDYRVQTLKQDALDAADQGGSSATSFFLIFGLFSIAAGVMLIFLIFVMLAAERRAEMGMARAIGTKRRHLIQQFLFEGYAYDLGAAIVGLVLGIAVSLGLVAVMSIIFNGSGFTIQRHFEPRSLVVAFCLGALVTFLTVVFSSWRVSRLNVVAAIRDLPEDIGLKGSLGDAFRQSVKNVTDLRRHRVRAVVLVAAAALLFAESGGPAGPIVALVLYALWSFRPVLLGLIARGPLLLLAGVLLLLVGLSSKEEFPFKLGVSLVLIGIAMLVRWFLQSTFMPDRTRNRIGYSLGGILLVVFWSLPFDALQALGVPQLHGDVEMFFLSGMMLVLGGVWTLMYNLDLLLGAFLRTAGGLGKLAPMIKMAVTYPTQHRFRTGLTMAMFSLVIFTLMVVSVLLSSFNNTALDYNRDLGGWNAWGTTGASNPIRDINGQIAANTSLHRRISAAGGLGRISVDLRQPGQKDQSWQPYVVNVADDSYLNNTRPTFLHLRATGYADDQQVWQALRTHPGYAVVDDWLVKRKDGNNGNAPSFTIQGFYYGDKSFKPVHITMRDARTGKIIPLTVIGVLDAAGANASASFATVTRGVYVGQTTLAAAHDQPAVPTTFFFRTVPGQNVHQTALALGSAFLAHGLDMKEAKAQWDTDMAANNGFWNMLRGFLGLGLVVGIAALGVIASRSVVERRQQIGMMRAIGFQRRMVRTSFLMESSFIAILGTLLGVALGLLLARQLVASFAKDDPTLHLVIPWLQVGAITVLAYAASLFTTYLPAWHASRIYPAEALRYE